MKKLSRRGFLTGTNTKPMATVPVVTPPTPPPTRSFLEDFYASRAQASTPPLVYEPTTFVWDEALLARAKRQEKK
jgi:hypothetical protein